MSELKQKLCALFELEDGDVRLWDFYRGEYYEKLEDKLDLTLEVAKLLPKQQVMLEEKVRSVIRLMRSGLARGDREWLLNEAQLPTCSRPACSPEYRPHS